MHLLQEQSDVFVDACAADHRAQLLFISVFGRDTSIQQLMARIHLRATQGGVDQLSVAPAVQGRPLLKVLTGDPNRLEKTVGRCPKASLLGNLVHAWIFDPVLLKPDPAIGVGWVLLRSETLDPLDQARKLWRMLKDLSPVPLLDHWGLPIMNHLVTIGAVVRPPCVGPIHALRLELPDDFMVWVSERVKSGDFVETPRSERARSTAFAELAHAA